MEELPDVFELRVTDHNVATARKEDLEKNTNLLEKLIQRLSENFVITKWTDHVSYEIIYKFQRINTLRAANRQL